MEESKKLYSQKAISIATYIGGPLAAGILIRQNSLSLGREKEGRNALIFGIVSTFLLFAAIFSVPEHIIDKVPNSLLPLIYTGIIYLIVEKIHGIELNNHKEQNGEFYSGWRAAGIGSIGMVIIVAFIFAFVFLSPNMQDFDTAAYDSGVSQFTENEAKALVIYNKFETTPPRTIISELNKGIVLWKENQKILEKLNQIENLPSELMAQNKALIQYCNLRIEHSNIIIKAVSEDTDKYVPQIESIGNQINDILEKLN